MLWRDKDGWKGEGKELNVRSSLQSPHSPKLLNKAIALDRNPINPC